MAVFISLTAGAINVNALSRGSAIAIGEISQTGWTQNGKNNFGDGQFFGSNIQIGVVTILIDNDVIDNPITENQPSGSLQNQIA
ncbi:MAG: hypothetical protein JWR03_2404 [Cohnella sp.]|nr:hypothetical protein [Cohnella sp.]